MKGEGRREGRRAEEMSFHQIQLKGCVYPCPARDNK